MERVPVEILQCILSYLDTSDIARVTRTCRSFSLVARPCLFRILDIQLNHGNPLPATEKCLRLLARNPQLLPLIRGVAVENKTGTHWTAGHASLLKIALSPLIDRNTQIRSFSWKAVMIFTDAYFPDLAHLECAAVCCQSEVDWIRWHLFHCQRLKTLSLSLHPLLSPIARRSLFSGTTGPPRLRALSLCGFDLSNANPAAVLGPAVRCLDFRYCAGMNEFLSRVATMKPAPQLRSFRALGIMRRDRLEQFLSTLAETSLLEELSLCLQLEGGAMSLRCIALHAPALRGLILDFRSTLWDVDSAIQYTVGQFEDILARFPRLVHVGIPLQLKDPLAERYKRVKFKRQDLHTKPLRTLHIRRRCPRQKQSNRDAVHVATPFHRRNGFTVLLDTGQRLRKMIFGAHGRPQPATIPNSERAISWADL